MSRIANNPINVPGGVEVTLLGDRTTLPSGPAVRAVRTGAPLPPPAVDVAGRRAAAHARPPVAAERGCAPHAHIARPPLRARAAPSPTFFTAFRPKRIFPSTTAKSACDAFTSGGSTSIPISSHAAT